MSKNVKGVFINGERSGYDPDQCYSTLTIQQLIDQLEGIKQYCGEDAPVYLYNDNGYTYGHINEDTIGIGEYTDSGVEFDEYDECRGDVFYNA